MMHFEPDSAVFAGAAETIDLNGMQLPFEYTGPRSEYLACRETAWLGLNLNNTPVYDISGPDAAAFLEATCVNKGFDAMAAGRSKHALVCNDRGQLLADGVIMKRADGTFRTYWLAPALQFFVEMSALDVTGTYNPDEYFFQIDGPRSLEILEEACQCDLHDIAFARNRTVSICGTEMVVHRLGMSGALAYEVHGAEKDAEVAFRRLREVVERFGGKCQGVRNYGILNHTPAGYPNQLQHFDYALVTSTPELTEFASRYCWRLPLRGSASADPSSFLVTPFDIGWGYLVNFDHDFPGRDALAKIHDNPPRSAVTLEWNTEDVGDVFMSQFRGRDVEPYDAIEPYTQLAETAYMGIRGDYVMADDEIIGIATGRTYAFFERHMISLAFIDRAYAEEGRELIVRWGTPGGPMKDIHATVAPFPYYHGEYRNETFDTEKIPHRTF